MHYLHFFLFLTQWIFWTDTHSRSIQKQREDSNGNNLAHDQHSHLLFWSCPHCPWWISCWVPKAISQWWGWWIHPVQMRQHSLSAGNGMCFVRAEVTHREMWWQCVKPGVACLSHCLVLPHPVERLQCAHVYMESGTHLFQDFTALAANEELGPEKHRSSRAKGWQCS